MKNRVWLFFLLCLLSLSSLSGCKKEDKAERTEAKLSKEFTLEKVSRELEALAVDGIVFDEAVSAGKVSSLGHDSSGSSLGYILKDEALEKLIRLLQDESIFGVELSKEEYQSAMKQAISGYMIEFMDSKDQFKEGVARLSCLTGTGKYYMNIIIAGKGSKNYRIALPDKVVDFLNEKSKENYNESSSNPGWFDEAFK